MHTTGDPLEGILLRSGLLITALGVTVAEGMALGVPVAVFYNWKKDRPLVQKLASAGLVADLGFHQETTAESLGQNLTQLLLNWSLRQSLGFKGWAHVDGLGAARAAQMINDLSNNPAEWPPSAPHKGNKVC
jgi:spore coat polysaccharide biosynthesis predicted glycosyltransferase SpsG